jgi:L-seryl-tRNA(Ser) seleniumtransferase
LNKKTLRKLPSIDELINRKEIKQLIEKYNRDVVVNAARIVLDKLRNKIIKNNTIPKEEDISVKTINKQIKSYLKKRFAPSLQKAVNATGIILHTGLGRAVLPKKAIEAINEVIKGYCTLAVDIETGQRAHRDIHLNDLICELTGAEAATVTNNNAAATILILNTLAKNNEVILSRGQMVEIGGSFRIPEVMESSGAILREVGTTNKTHLKDYANAINENTGAILKVHQSNYRIVGFTEEPSIEELVKLARKHNLPVIDDLGSGALIDLEKFGLESEPMVRHSIKAGAEVTCFSADKLIGGPQAGIIVGKAKTIEKIRKNPLSRAFRVGKMTIAGLKETLNLFLNHNRLCQEHPTYSTFSLNLKELGKRAKQIADKLSNLSKGKANISVIDGKSEVGSGSVPTKNIPTKLLSIKPKALSADNLARKLRYNNPPIFARIHKETVLFDLRTIEPQEDIIVQKALLKILK